MEYEVKFELRGDGEIVMTLVDKTGVIVFFEKVTDNVLKVSEERSKMHVCKNS